MLKKMSEVNTYSLDLRVGTHGQFPELTDMSGTQAGLVPGSLILAFDGVVDIEKDLAYDMAGSVKYKVGDSTELKVVGDIKYLDNKMYFQLSEVPNTQIADLSQLRGTWYKFDFADLSLAPQDLSKKESKVDEKVNKKMRKLIQSTDFLDVVKDNGKVDLNGREVFHYEVKLNASEVEKFMREATEIVEDRKLTDEEETEMEKTIQSMKDLTGQVWIGEDDNLLYRLEVGVQIENEQGQMRYDIAADFDNFDEKVEIKEPSDVRDFNMAELFMPAGMNFDMSGGSGVDADIDIEEQLKQIENMDPEELQKQLEELQKGFDGMNVQY